MKNKDAAQLLLKYRQGNCTEAEIAMLESWYLNYTDAPLTELTPDALDTARNKVWASLPVHHQKKTARLWPMMAAAASVIIIMAAGFLFFQNNKKAEVVKKPTDLAEILPGGNKAMLTLADGSKISLTDVKEGSLASQSGVTITKTKDGQLVYHVNNSNSEGDKPAGYNIFSTPRGGKYEVNLPDGTKIILNAESSLRYPAKFTGSERRVELKGEAYFEVAHDRNRPFRVVSDHQTIEVLGTHFNVNAYDDEENIKTTLLEGKVKVSVDEGSSVIIKPGEQAVAGKNKIKIDEVNTDDIVAWTTNTFVFSNENLGSIMRKISRWYDVEVVCPPELAKMEFSGTISRQRNIKDVLKIMDLTETVHFKFEGRRITVMP